MKVAKIQVALCIAVMATAWSSRSRAQDNYSRKGVVVDSVTRMPLAGVNIEAKDFHKSAQTDGRGNFSLKAPASAALHIFYVGYATLETSTPTDTIRLKPIAGGLQQEVILGYGVKRGTDVISNISNTTGDELSKQPIQSATQGMQDKVAGVYISGSGQPDLQPQVRIRGTTSMLGGLGPLYVVDGVFTDDIRSVNSGDILSVNILKDASAAIYGMRAANGVIIITTRDGNPGHLKLTYDDNFGVNTTAHGFKLADRNQYLSYLQDAAPGSLANNQPPLTYSGSTDWYKAILRSSFEQGHNITASGGGKRLTYYFVADYGVLNGIVVTNQYERFTSRANIEYKLSNRISIGTKFSFEQFQERAAPLSTNHLFQSAYNAAPVVESQTATGQYGNTSVWGGVLNPLLGINAIDDKISGDRLQGNLHFDYQISKTLNFHSAYNLDIRNSHEDTYNYAFDNSISTFNVPGGGQIEPVSLLNVVNQHPTDQIWDNVLTYDQSFGLHHLNILAGESSESYYFRGLNGARNGVDANKSDWELAPPGTPGQTVLQGMDNYYTWQSYFGRISYSYAGKYLAEATLRDDESNLFRHQWGHFPAVKAGWVISEEEFLKNSPVLSYLKLYGTWSRLGNANIPVSIYTTFNTYAPNYYGATYNYPSPTSFVIPQESVYRTVPDNHLLWETTSQTDAGLAYGFFKNKLTGELSYYNKNTSNALAYVVAANGAPELANVASLYNRGAEFSFKWQNKVNNNFSYTIGGNLTYNKNKVTALNNGLPVTSGEVGNQAYVTRTVAGQPIGSFYLLKATGVFQSQAQVNAAAVNTFEPNRVGGLIYQDINGDGKIDNNDRVYSGSYQPKFYGGLSFGFDYKGIDFSADIYGNWGGKVYDAQRAYRMNAADNVDAQFAASRWTPSNPSNTTPQILTPFTPSSTYFLQPGGFVRLNNLVVGYSFKPDGLKHLGITGLRLYMATQNLVTLQKFNGFTPEIQNTNVLASGVVLDTYPSIRTLSFGINAKFF